MPRRNDLQKILVIGSGPIIIGQACEFDYSGSQAIKALKEEGYSVVLVNSNPATIMTDLELADQIYIEPITVRYLSKIIEIEEPDAILPTVGGQTALNITLELVKTGILDKYNIELIGAKQEAIEKAEDRELFRKAMLSIGVKVPQSYIVGSLEETHSVVKYLGFPIILRPSFTLGGLGGGIYYTQKEFEEGVQQALIDSPSSSVLLEQSLLGWKEFELEVMRDLADNVIIICSIENLDPMGIHTGDSITVAPQQTLSDKQYQKLRNMSINIIREIGVETGGSNIQFAVNPTTNEVMVIEMNPRVSRSSALASKATGFPIARIAAKLAVGYLLHEITNDITKKTPSSFEPSIDYIVTKIPYFTFEKFKGSNLSLGTQMKSVGEVMAIGRTFGESFQKGLRSLEKKRDGWGVDGIHTIDIMFAQLQSNDKQKELLKEKLSCGNEFRVFYIRKAFEVGFTLQKIYNLSKIDTWFLTHFQYWLTLEKEFLEFLKKYSVFGDYIKSQDIQKISTIHSEFTEEHPLIEIIYSLKKNGYSDRQISFLINKDFYDDYLLKVVSEKQGSLLFLEYQHQAEINLQQTQKYLSIVLKGYFQPVYKRIDTCAAEFESSTPYLYMSYEQEDEADVSDRKKVIILGSGPNRIGQGSEFDYSCCQAVYALKDMGIESIMVNSNPETVSTDFDTSDRLYFEPITLESVLNIYNKEKENGEVLGIIPQFGGQTPLKLLAGLVEQGVSILGTSVQNIDRAEDRELFLEILTKSNLKNPKSSMATTTQEALKIAEEITYPVMVRPSYVLGGRAMCIVDNKEELLNYMNEATEVSVKSPLLIDKFLHNAIEIDVDALYDGKDIFIAGILEHIEEAGIHSGDSATFLPSKNISEPLLQEIKQATLTLAQALEIRGFLNIQFAIQNNNLFVIELNPRASRTVPFISKALRVPLSQVATKIMLGKTLKEMNFTHDPVYKYKYVKEVSLPFKKFVGSNVILGPEMRSTGEVMGVGKTYEEAFIKSQEAVDLILPTEGNIFISMDDTSKSSLLEAIHRLSVSTYFSIYATDGTVNFLNKNNIKAIRVKKIFEGAPNVCDLIEAEKFQIVINVSNDHVRANSIPIRRACLDYNIPYFTTISASIQAIDSVLSLKDHELEVYPFK